MSKQDPIVQTQHLTKRYNNFTALSDLNLTIERGSIYGFIGPNGAGKTTTMRILATLLAAHEGQAWVSGYPVTERAHGGAGSASAICPTSSACTTT